MGHAFSLPRLLGMTEATAISGLDGIETDLLLCIVRVLICEEPGAIGRLVCCCKMLLNLSRANTEEGEELRKARRIVAREWLFNLRRCAGLQPAALAPLVTQISRQLSFRALRPEIDEPCEIDISRWHRPAQERPRLTSILDDHTRGTSVKRVLYANQTIVSIQLSVCYLTHSDAKEIGKGLKVNKSLTKLDASGNFFGGYGREGKFIRSPEGMDSIADALSVSALTTLILAENRLGPEGIKALVPGLALTCLTSLDLSRNSIGVVGAAELAAGLAINSSLLHLDVRLNKLGPEGAKTLAPGIAVCSSLRALDARFNGVEAGDEGVTALNEATKGRSGFELMVLNFD